MRPRADQRPQHGAHAADAKHQPDGIWRRPLALRDHQHQQHHAGVGKDHSAMQQGKGARHRLAPEPDHPLPHVGAQAAPLLRAIFLKRQANPREREHRSGKGDGIYQKWQRTRHAEERTAQRRTEERHRAAGHLVLRRGGGQLRLGHHTGQRRRLRQAEEDIQRAFDQRDEIELRQRQPTQRQRLPTQRQRQWDAAQRQRPSGVAEHHGPLAVPAVDERAGGQTQQQIGQRAQRSGEAGLGGRMSEAQHEQRKGQHCGLAAHRRDGLAAPQEQVVAIAPKWLRRGGRAQLGRDLLVGCHGHPLSSDEWPAVGGCRRQRPHGRARAGMPGARCCNALNRGGMERRGTGVPHVHNGTARDRHVRPASDRFAGGALFRRVSTSAALTRPEQEAVCQPAFHAVPGGSEDSLPGKMAT